ncbi:MAG TPA: hypothetical protein DCM54_17975 [Gammaproteobacteria bacterium]|nr:hypothetical protein [Gammaproteobacteria bacterium]
MRINEITIADEPEAWRARGFTVENDRVTIGESYVVHLTGGEGGVTAWTLGVDGKEGSTTVAPRGMGVTVTQPMKPEGPTDHEIGITHSAKAIVWTADTAASVVALQGAIPEFGPPSRDGLHKGTHFAIWPLDDTDVGLEVVCLDPDQGDDTIAALFFVVEDFDKAVERMGVENLIPEDVYGGRRRVIIKPGIGVSLRVHFLAPV